MRIETFAHDGYALIPGMLAPAACDALAREAGLIGVTGAGSRNVLGTPWCARFAATLKRECETLRLLPEGAAAVQCTLFEKSSRKNWSVAPHQDLSIPVRERTAAPECTGWARKEGVYYTQPPARVLENLIAIRVHLDPCPADAGPLRVVPGSHLHGRLPEDAFERLRAAQGEVECIAGRGDALVMRPLLVHSSPRMTVGGRRRVLHFLFGPPDLPCGLRWHLVV